MEINYFRCQNEFVSNYLRGKNYRILIKIDSMFIEDRTAHCTVHTDDGFIFIKTFRLNCPDILIVYSTCNCKNKFFLNHSKTDHDNYCETLRASSLNVSRSITISFIYFYFHFIFANLENYIKK